MSKLAILALAVALCATAVAQSRVSMGRPAAGPVGMGGRHFGAGISVVERGHRHPFGRSPFFFLYGAPYFYSDDYEPYDLQYAKSEPAPQPVSSEANPGPLPEPVLLELHGSQWVKVTNFGETSQQALNPSSQSASAKPMPAAVLVYRDGHSEEISSYSIIDRVMYTKADYYSSGSWTRTIQIADLDIPATLKQNQRRGVKFDLPSGPDEVVIRP
ncbi:MAG: hypothetical protein DMG97_26140 [Acidobacteria bacterium]|nr:MAG: hypothetical protein DMG97_26140 [Acidobacteriota bacterium]